jgi:F-type H+-transporting ATPase subunit gamma
LPGQDGQDRLRRQEGLRRLRRDIGSQDRRPVDLREVKRGFGNADEIGKKLGEMFDEGEFDVCTLFYSAFQSVISQVPTAQQLIPANVAERRKAEKCRPRRGLRIRAGRERDPRGSAAAQHCRPDFPRAAGKRRLRAGRADDAMDNATRNAGEMIDKLTLSYNRQRQAQITKELIEIISGAEAL